MPDSTLRSFTAHDGSNLAVVDWPLPSGAPSRGLVVIVHGLGEHALRHAALAQRLWHPVTLSVVYRLLARHGWRKVAPDTRHPKSDPLTQEQWKKNSPMCWMPSSTPQRSVAAESA